MKSKYLDDWSSYISIIQFGWATFSDTAHIQYDYAHIPTFFQTDLSKIDILVLSTAWSVLRNGNTFKTLINITSSNKPEFRAYR